MTAHAKLDKIPQQDGRCLGSSWQDILIGLRRVFGPVFFHRLDEGGIGKVCFFMEGSPVAVPNLSRCRRFP